MGSSDTRKELLTAIDGLAKRGGMTRDKALAAWYASTLLGIEEDEAIDAASVDGPGDNGCDLIYVDDEQAQVIVLQGYVSDRVERATPVKKWNALTASIGSVKDPESFQHGGRADIYERLKDVNLDDYSLVFGVRDEGVRNCAAARKTQMYTCSSGLKSLRNLNLLFLMRVKCVSSSDNPCSSLRSLVPSAFSIVYRSVSVKVFDGARRRGLLPSLSKIHTYGSWPAGQAGSHHAFK